MTRDGGGRVLSCMAATSKSLLLASLLYCVGCSVASSADDPPEGIGPVIARYSLATEDGNVPPCCVTDSANVRITVVGGALTFNGPANYSDTVFTPGGPASRSCVHEVPNGSNLNTFTHIVTLSDSTSYFQLPCDRGTYTLRIIRELAQSGASTSDTATISAGTFNARPDNVDLVDSRNRAATALVSDSTILVTTSAHHYRFDPVR